MSDMIKKVALLRKKELLQYAAIETGAFLFGILIMMIIRVRADRQDTWFPLGSIFALCVLLFLIVLMGAFSFVQDYTDAVTMSQARRLFTAAYMVTDIIGFAVCYALTGLMYLFESRVLMNTMHIRELERYMRIGVQLPIVMAVLVFLIGLKLLIGALLMRFGKKAFWVMWAVWMCACIAPGRIANSMDGKDSVIGNLFTDIFRCLFHLEAPAKLLIYFVVLMVLYVPAIIMLRKQSVSSYK